MNQKNERIIKLITPSSTCEILYKLGYCIISVFSFADPIYFEKAHHTCCSTLPRSRTSHRQDAPSLNSTTMGKLINIYL